jgi:hypothetical protein
LVDLARSGRTSIHLSHLVVDILSIVIWHFHASIVVFQSRAAHLESLLADCCDTSEVGLIALILQNGLFAQLNSVFFFQFFNHGLKELAMSFLLVDSSMHLVFDLLLFAALLHLVASELRPEFEMSDRPHFKSTIVELATEFVSLLLPRQSEVLFLFLAVPCFADPPDSPLVNPLQNNLLIAFDLKRFEFKY